MSDGFYDVPSSTASGAPTLDRPTSKDPRVRLARAQQSSVSEEHPEVLHNSLSEGDYSRHSRPRRAAIRRSSVADPDFYLGDSMSDGFYEMPATLRAAAFRPRRRQSFRSAWPQSLPLVHRVVAATRSGAATEPLQNSLAHGDYSGPRR